ncbi:MAG: hypothetical protein HYY37_03135 [Candidatus Aenigmarchaeota archaeon]|nr:hypothetical protein [Candidatus Aenigmarchaeota archaeon]
MALGPVGPAVAAAGRAAAHYAPIAGRYAAQQAGRGIAAGYRATRRYGPPAARFAGRKAWQATRFAARQTGRGIRNGARFVRDHPRGSAVAAATAAGGVLGLMAPEAIATAPYVMRDAANYLSHGRDTGTVHFFDRMGDATTRQAASTIVDNVAGAATGAFLAGRQAYRWLYHP